MRERMFYEQAVEGYLEAVDALDVAAVLEFLADDPMLVVEPAGAVLRGRDEVHGALAQLLDASAAMRHEVLALTVDCRAGRVAIELNFHDTPRGGGPTRILHDSTHLQFDEEGKIRKIQFWLGHDLTR